MRVRRARARARARCGRPGSACRPSSAASWSRSSATAGVGKSRLTAEALASVDGARSCAAAASRTARGSPTGRSSRCVEQLDAAARPTRRRRRRSARCSARRDARERARTRSPGRSASCSEAAAERPLVVVFDDIQWAEETFLDLVEQIALLSAGAPILLLCLARPELLERRPRWPVAAPARAAAARRGRRRR